jgi:hypothetical protein
MEYTHYQIPDGDNNKPPLIIKSKLIDDEKQKEKVFPYPEANETEYKTFQIKYEKKLSSTAKSILNCFQKKYLYSAIEDISYLLKTNPVEQQNLLAILYSPIISLQNNFFINVFDIWIDEVYIEEVSKMNKFLKSNYYTSNQFNSITLKFFYRISKPIKKRSSIW